MVIAVDFDGTLTKQNCFPKIGELRKNAVEVIQNLQKHGHKCFLWTCREGKYLEDAKKYLESKGLYMDGYNVSPYDNINNGRKAIADLYIDDRNIQMIRTGFDWKRIESIILSDRQAEDEKIEILRSNFRENIGPLCKKCFHNTTYAIDFIFNRLSINKIGCMKSIQCSVNNGFTPEEHFLAAENIKDLFEHSKVYETDSRLAKNERLELIFKCVSKVTDNVFAYMNVITWGKNEGYIDLYLSKEAE